MEAGQREQMSGGYTGMALCFIVIHGLIIYFSSVVCDCIQVNMIGLLFIALSLLSERS